MTRPTAHSEMCMLVDFDDGPSWHAQSTGLKAFGHSGNDAKEVLWADRPAAP